MRSISIWVLTLFLLATAAPAATAYDPPKNGGPDRSNGSGTR